jgi:hypothetical protein
MSFDFSLLRAKAKKYAEWERVLTEMVNDAEGCEVLKTFLISENGHRSSISKPASARQMPLKPTTKKAQLRAALIEAAGEFDRPFGASEMMEALNRRNFQFSMSDHSVELGGGLRLLVADGTFRVEREKVGRIGRLYAMVSAVKQKPPDA